jgi:glycosyltransferase involved in cell wall biosynthesis
MNILFFGDYWDDMWRRRQQLAWRLAQSDLVEHLVYIERPLPITSFLRFLIGCADRDGIDRWHRVLRNRSWIMQKGEKLSVLTSFAPLPPVGCKSLFHASEQARDRWLLNRIKKLFDFRRPMVWISYPQISVEVIQTLEPSLLWYDCTEDFSAFPELPDCTRAQIKVADSWLTSHANVVTAVSNTLYEEKRLVNANTYWLPNAVDTELFLKPKESFCVPLELQGISRPVLTFVGGLNEWAHDWELLDQVATLRPEWNILLIGGLSVSLKTCKMLQNRSNIICVGRKPYHDIPSYLAHSDVCFQLYQIDRANDTRNSQKLFLYLAAGKPVVSTQSADVENYRHLVEIAGTAKAFVAGVERVLVDDSPETVRRRQEFARENDWSARVGQIRQILEDMGNSR